MSFEKYFEMEYLIGYGYFDLKNSKSTKVGVYEEDPEYASSTTIHKDIFNCNILHIKLPAVLKSIDYNYKKETEPIIFSVYKNDEERRIYKYPNMYSYICLVNHLVENRDK